jgi:hypothetical protein
MSQITKMVDKFKVDHHWWRSTISTGGEVRKEATPLVEQ